MGSARGVGSFSVGDGGRAEMSFFAGMVVGMAGGIAVTMWAIAFMTGATK